MVRVTRGGICSNRSFLFKLSFAFVAFAVWLETTKTLVLAREMASDSGNASRSTKGIIRGTTTKGTGRTGTVKGRFMMTASKTTTEVAMARDLKSSSGSYGSYSKSSKGSSYGSYDSYSNGCGNGGCGGGYRYGYYHNYGYYRNYCYRYLREMKDAMRSKNDDEHADMDNDEESRLLRICNRRRRKRMMMSMWRMMWNRGGRRWRNNWT